ncbi:hypothetical protein [Schwartzia sp. (in: firmicutes)]
MMKKFFASAAAAMLLMGTVPAMAAPELSSVQVSEAQVKANRIVPNKKINFVFAEWQDFRTDENFMQDDIRTTADAYWITPYCHVMNEQITQTRTGSRDFKAIPEAGKEYQLRIMIASRRLDIDAIRGAEITVKQGRRELVPMRVRYTNIQRVEEKDILYSTTWNKIGLVLDFAVEDVDEKLPLSVTVRANGSTPIIFPEFENKIEYDSYDTKQQEFKWYPLHDRL